MRKLGVLTAATSSETSTTAADPKNNPWNQPRPAVATTTSGGWGSPKPTGWVCPWKDSDASSATSWNNNNNKSTAGGWGSSTNTTTTNNNNSSSGGWGKPRTNSNNNNTTKKEEEKIRFMCSGRSYSTTKQEVEELRNLCRFPEAGGDDDATISEEAALFLLAGTCRESWNGASSVDRAAIKFSNDYRTNTCDALENETAAASISTGTPSDAVSFTCSGKSRFTTKREIAELRNLCHVRGEKISERAALMLLGEYCHNVDGICSVASAKINFGVFKNDPARLQKKLATTSLTSVSGLELNNEKEEENSGGGGAAVANSIQDNNAASTNPWNNNSNNNNNNNNNSTSGGWGSSTSPKKNEHAGSGWGNSNNTTTTSSGWGSSTNTTANNNSSSGGWGMSRTNNNNTTKNEEDKIRFMCSGRSCFTTKREIEDLRHLCRYGFGGGEESKISQQAALFLLGGTCRESGNGTCSVPAAAKKFNRDYYISNTTDALEKETASASISTGTPSDAVSFTCSGKSRFTTRREIEELRDLCHVRGERISQRTALVLLGQQCQNVDGICSVSSAKLFFDVFTHDSDRRRKTLATIKYTSLTNVSGVELNNEKDDEEENGGGGAAVATSIQDNNNDNVASTNPWNNNSNNNSDSNDITSGGWGTSTSPKKNEHAGSGWGNNNNTTP